MEILKLKDALGGSRNRVKEAIIRGDIFIYPTDTVYGIGCNAGKKDSVEKIKKTKGREGDKPFSVIVPSLDWVDRNCVVNKVNRQVLGQLLPGPYTAVLKKRGGGTIGVRIPRNEFTDMVRETGSVFVTTSVNKTGEEPMVSVGQAPEEIKKFVDWIIDAGMLGGSSSRVFDLTGDDIKILRY